MKTGLVIFNQLAQGYFSKHWKEDLIARGFDCLYADPAKRETNFQEVQQLLSRQSYKYLLITAGNVPLEYNHIQCLNGVTKILFLTDDDWQFCRFSRFYGLAFDWIVTTYKDNIALYKEHGFKRVILSQWGFNHNLYRRMSIQKDIPVSLIGRPHGDRIAMLTYLLGEGIDLHIYGTGWEKLSEFKQYYRGPLSDEEMVTVINRTKINLNPMLAGDRSTVQIKGRTFELSGCGAFQLTNRNNQLLDFFEEDKEIILFESYNDLLGKIRYYLGNESEREAIASAAYHRSLKDHTWKTRLDDIFLKIENPAVDITAPCGSLRRQPKVNVLYDARRKTELCRDTLASLDRQDYDHFDVFVVSDSLLSKIDRPRFIQFHSLKDGIECLDGEYVAFIQDGDVWAPEKLTFQLWALENDNLDRSAVSLTLFGLYLHDPKDEIIYYQYTDAGHVENHRCYILPSSLVVGAELVRRSIQEFIKFLDYGIMNTGLRKKILAPKRNIHYVDVQYSLSKINFRTFQDSLKKLYRAENEKLPFSKCWKWRVDRNRLLKNVLSSHRALDGVASLLVSLSLKKPVPLSRLWRALPISFN